MAQFGPKHVVSTRQSIRIEREWPIRLPAATGVVANVVTVGQIGGAGALYAMGIGTNSLKGQKLFLLEKTAGGSAVAGRTVTIIANTSNSGAVDDTITLDEIVQGTSTYASWPTYALADWARIGCTTYGIRPGAWAHSAINANYQNPALERMWGLIDQSDLPDAVHSGSETFAHGSTRMPNRHIYIFNQDTHPVNMELSAIDARDWSNFFGKVVEVASKFDTGSQSINLNVFPGDNEVVIDAAGAFTNNDYVQIGDGTNTDNTEIRKIISGGGTTTLILDRPLCFFHDASDANEIVKEVHADCYDAYLTADGVTHTMSAINGIPPSVSFGVHKKGEHDGVTVEDWYLVYLGARFSELSCRSTTSEELKASFRGTGHNAVLDPTNLAGTKVTPPTLDDTPYFSGGLAKEPVHWSRSVVTYETIEFPTTENFEITGSRDVSEQYFHAFNTANDSLKFGRKPLSYGTRVTWAHNFSVPLHKKRLYNLLQNRTLINGTAVFSIARSTAFTETWSWALTRMPVLEAGLELPNTPVESQEVLGPPESVTLAVYDKTPHY